jgi:O-antigen/teichoic acid export membrane protein
MSRIVAHVASNIEVALVSALVSPAAAAIYGLTDRLFRVALSLINPIAGSVLSALAHLLGEVGTKGVVKPLRDLFTLWSTAAALCFPILLAMNRDFVAIWVGSDKYGGLGLSSAICLSTLLSARSFLMYIVLNGLGEIAITAWVSTFEPALRLPLMVVGIKAFGSMGLPIAATMSVGILSFGIYPRYVARKIQLPGREGSALQLRGVSAVAATMLLGGLLAVFAPSVDHWLTFLAKTTIVSIGVMSLALAASRDVRALLWDLQGRVRARFAAAR